jgi:tryptophanase
MMVGDEAAMTAQDQFEVEDEVEDEEEVEYAVPINQQHDAERKLAQIRSQMHRHNSVEITRNTLRCSADDNDSEVKTAVSRLFLRSTLTHSFS